MIAAYLLCLLASLSASQAVTYQPTWASIDSRPLPRWYDESKLGIFIVWGVYAVPSTVSEWFWQYWQGPKPNAKVVAFMEKNYKPGFTYGDFAKDLTAEFFNAEQWAELLEASGAGYTVFVTKHHDGFTNWPSNHSFNWNTMDVGPKRDIVGELTEAVKKTKVRLGLYHSLFEWFHPLYLQDKARNYSTQDFVAQKTMPELYELVNKYKPDVVWSDGDWEAPSGYWNSTHFLAWLYNESPVKDTVVTNDRWGRNVSCHHGGFLTCSDRYNPGVLQKRKWENAMTIDKSSWGFRRDAPLAEYMTMEQLVQTFIKTVSCGGNMLMNVAPTKYGTISPIYEERLRGMGQWLKVNGEGVYSSVPWTFQNDTVNPDVWYTMKTNGASKDVYAFVLAWPKDATLALGAPISGASTVVTLLGHAGTFHYFGAGEQGMTITIPPISFADMPCQWVWTFKLTNIRN